MRRLSDVPWTSQRPPSSPSCPRWHRCGRRRAPRCRKKRQIYSQTLALLTSLQAPVRSCWSLVLGCWPQWSGMCQREEPAGAARWCWGWGWWGSERDLWIDGQRPNQPADSLKLSFSQISALCSPFDLPSSSQQDQWCWWSQRGLPHSQDQRSRPVSGKKVFSQFFLSHNLSFCVPPCFICRMSYAIDEQSPFLRISW